MSGLRRVVEAIWGMWESEIPNGPNWKDTNNVTNGGHIRKLAGSWKNGAK
jgi:hypothetical protein